jgi:E3 ubiquitin-protein ligase SHPRH
MACGTTLIVSPQSIAQQWIEEIEKHTEPGSLKVMVSSFLIPTPYGNGRQNTWCKKRLFILNNMYTHAQLYEGVKRATGYVSPAELASYDIVLVTYEALRTEFYHATSQEVSWNLRHRKRYVCYPSPLPAVHWWRVSEA